MVLWKCLLKCFLLILVLEFRFYLMSFLKMVKSSSLFDKSRGLRNCNPANIRLSGVKWIGMRDIQTDKEFVQFDNLRFGIRAFLILCRTYRKKYGIRRIAPFLSRFAPLAENDTFAYTKWCISYCGSDSLLTHADYFRFACAIFWYESRLSCTPDYVASVASQFKIKIL